MTAFPTGRLFAGKDLTPDYDVSLNALTQPEKFDTTLPGNSGLNPTNAQFLAYLATLPSWSRAAVTTAAEFNAAATAIDASGPAVGVIKFSASYNGDALVPPNRPLPSGVQPDYTTCTIYCIPETMPVGFPQPAAAGAPFAVRSVRDALPVIHSANSHLGDFAHGWYAIDQTTGGLAQYGYRWIGLRLSPRLDGGVTNYARMISSYQSRGIMLDRCYLDGVTDAQRGNREQPLGFWMDGRYAASLDSWYNDFMSAASEKQCILTVNGGPYKIVGNVLSGNGECYMSGGVDPQTPTVVDYYPRDLEFRRNFCRQQFGAIPLHPAFYQLAGLGGNARTLRTGMQAAAYNAGTRTLTLSAGTFDTALVDSTATRIARFWYVVSGAGAGSHGQATTYNSTASVSSADTSMTLITGTIDATSVVELRESLLWISKNCFELKTMRRAYIEGCILENAWNMDGSQRMIANLKSVNQGFTESGGAIAGGTLSLTSNVTWVNSLLLNCWGGINVTAQPSPPCLSCNSIHFQNLLLVATPTLTFVAGVDAFNFPWQLSADSITVRGCTALNFTKAIAAIWEDSNVTNSGVGSEHNLQHLVFDGYLAQDGPAFHLYGSNTTSGTLLGVAGYNGDVDTATATWRVGVCGPTVTSPTTQFPSTSNPGPAFRTLFSTDAAPWVNPLYDFTDPTCDYSIKPADPLAAEPNLGVDWPTLKAAVASVRPATNVVPYQWLGTEVTSADGPLTYCPIVR